MEKLGVLGCGNMGYAIMNGIMNSGLAADVYAYDVDTERLVRAAAKRCSSENELVQTCKFVLLAVKPQVLASVLGTIKESVTADTVFISICAGVSAEFIRKHTIPEAKVILVMPNTPMMLGLGASAIARGEGVSDDEFAFAKSIIESCGIAEEIPIDRMKEIICVNGSSPAFIYLFAKGFVDYAAENGIDSETTLRLFAATLAGSAKMLTNSGMTVDELIKQVSSPGGTTIAGLEKLYDGRLTDIVNDACAACTKRAYELSE